MKQVLFNIIRIYEGLRRRASLAYHRILLKKLGSHCQIDYAVYMPGKQNICIGSGCVINRGVIVQSCEGAEVLIGDNVTLSYGVKIITGGLDYSADLDNRRHVVAGIEIGDRTWIGVNAVILPGVRIGSGAVIAAGAVINRDVDSNCLVGGVPGKVIRRLDKEHTDV